MGVELKNAHHEVEFLYNKNRMQIIKLSSKLDLRPHDSSNRISYSAVYEKRQLSLNHTGKQIMFLNLLNWPRDWDSTKAVALQSSRGISSKSIENRRSRNPLRL